MAKYSRLQEEEEEFVGSPAPDSVPDDEPFREYWSSQDDSDYEQVADAKEMNLKVSKKKKGRKSGAVKTTPNVSLYSDDSDFVTE